MELLVINGHDYTAFLEKLSPVKNDLDADGSGRNILDGIMYRCRIATKETIMLSLLNDLEAEYVDVTTLDPISNTQVTKTVYVSSRNCGGQRYNPGKGVTEYIGCNFKMTER